MILSLAQQEMLDGKYGRSAQKAMQILAALGAIYGAGRMVPVASVQIAGVSYDNLGEAGLEFLSDMTDGGAHARVLTTLNPAGTDIDNSQPLGISEDFVHNQERILEAFARMGVITTCSCTPYLSGNLPHYGEHIAWSESSAVCFANSVLGARTNREGGPSALAAAITGVTPEYGYHLDAQRRAAFSVLVRAKLEHTSDFGALGAVIGRHIEGSGIKPVPLIRGIPGASLENLKSFCASLATFGGAALFHMEGITPESAGQTGPEDTLVVTQKDIHEAAASLTDARPDEVDFVSLGCPHLSIREITRLVELLNGKRIKKTVWITTSRPVKHMADRMGYTRIIEDAGAVFATDTCCVVAPLKGRFKALATDSAKACYYAASKNKFKTRLLTFEQAVEEALR
ncbi:MAG: aconitase X catalytic domain-containing protein [Omnitrophica WOR_2 bacterium]